MCAEVLTHHAVPAEVRFVHFGFDVSRDCLLMADLLRLLTECVFDDFLHLADLVGLHIGGFLDDFDLGLLHYSKLFCDNLYKL